jgi:hypothetical protein
LKQVMETTNSSVIQGRKWCSKRLFPLKNDMRFNIEH